jgi:hypothetical protein
MNILGIEIGLEKSEPLKKIQGAPGFRIIVQSVERRTGIVKPIPTFRAKY